MTFIFQGIQRFVPIGRPAGSPIHALIVPNGCSTVARRMRNGLGRTVQPLLHGVDHSRVLPALCRHRGRDSAGFGTLKSGMIFALGVTQRLLAKARAFNEVCIPLQSARGLRNAATALTGIEYNLVQQTRVNGLSKVEGEALLTRFGIVETGNFDYQAKDIVALVARVLIDSMAFDVYVTHLYMSRGDDSLRLFQVQQLLAWIDTRDDVTASIVCGDFNATLDAPSATLMATRFRPTQTEPTAFTPLADSDGSVSHPDRARMDRCIDYIWVAGAIRIVAAGVCFNQPSPEDPSLWPSDHIGVWADLEFGG